MKLLPLMVVGALLSGRAPVSEDPGRLVVEVVKAEAPAPFYLNRVTVRFVNTGASPIRILKPLDGSQHGMYSPSYFFAARDESGAEMSHIPRSCGLSGTGVGTRWPDDYVVSVPGHGAYQLTLPLQLQIPREGAYTLSFRYVVGQTLSDRYPLPENVWRGSVVSEGVPCDLRQMASR